LDVILLLLLLLASSFFSLFFDGPISGSAQLSQAQIKPSLSAVNQLVKQSTTSSNRWLAGQL
jgi:hypothetical protein